MICKNKIINNKQIEKIMNDDRKFRERSEMMKELFLARIHPEVISKIAGISEATVQKDRGRVASFYGIDVPKTADTGEERQERFQFLLKEYARYCVSGHFVRGKYPLYEAARLTIDFEKIENAIAAMEGLWNELLVPQIDSEFPFAKGYNNLIRDCLPIEKGKFREEFFSAIDNGTLSIDSVNQEWNVVELAMSYFGKVKRDHLVSHVIKDAEKTFKPVFSSLKEKQYDVISKRYGLDGEKLNLDEISSKCSLSRERVRQILEKTRRLIRIFLEENDQVLCSAAVISCLENQLEECNSTYRDYCESTDNEMAKLHAEIDRLKGILDSNGIEVREEPALSFVEFLALSVYDAKFPSRIANKLHAYDYVIDIVDDRENLMNRWSFGKKSLKKLDDFFLENGVDVSKLTDEDRAAARELIKKNK